MPSHHKCSELLTLILLLSGAFLLFTAQREWRRHKIDTSLQLSFVEECKDAVKERALAAGFSDSAAEVTSANGMSPCPSVRDEFY